MDEFSVIPRTQRKTTFHSGLTVKNWVSASLTFRVSTWYIQSESLQNSSISPTESLDSWVGCHNIDRCGIRMTFYIVDRGFRILCSGPFKPANINMTLSLERFKMMLETRKLSVASAKPLQLSIRFTPSRCLDVPQALVPQSLPLKHTRIVWHRTRRTLSIGSISEKLPRIQQCSGRSTHWSVVYHYARGQMVYDNEQLWYLISKFL